MVHTEKHLKECGITLPPPVGAKANYVPCQRDGNLLYLSGHLPMTAEGTLMTGRIGPGGETVEHGYAAARQAALNIVSTLKEQLGDLDRVEQVVKLFGIVQSHEDFKEQHVVMNGCSDLLVEVFGKERGMHARSAIGTNSLPLDISVEIEAIVRIKP
jgi:enamine deaminase RidA (YjgF/YER057c/UK114 family)